MAETTTLAFTEDPGTARLRFKLRGLNNILLVAVIFGGVAILAVNTAYVTIIDLVTGSVLLYVFFFFLEKRTIGFRCPHCQAHISSNTPWVCGFKECSNLNIVSHPFVHCCENCGAEPKAYVCHHCRKTIFLSSDKLAANAARCLNLSAPSSTAEPQEEIQRQRQEQKQQREHDIAIAELDERLGKIKERTDGPKLKKPGEKLAEKLEQGYLESMGLREYAKKKRAEVAEMYKDDPESLKDANAAIDEIVRRMI
jgi:hypothetical protein